MRENLGLQGSPGSKPFSRVKTQWSNLTARSCGPRATLMEEDVVYEIANRKTEPTTVPIDRDDVPISTTFNVVCRCSRTLRYSSRRGAGS